MLSLSMRKQPLTKKLGKPVHPTLGKAALGGGILLAAGALVLLFLKQSAPFPLSTPTILTTPTLPYSELPDKLQVSSSVSAPLQRHINPQPWSTSIDDSVVVQRLYNAILALPSYPTPNPALHLVGHCVNNPILTLYELNFFKNGKLFR